MPIIVPRKNAVVTHPYQASPPRWSSMSGRIVMTASDSKATSVTTETRPMRSARRSPAGGSRAGPVLTTGTVRPRATWRSRAGAARSVGDAPEALAQPGGPGDRALDGGAEALLATDHDQVPLGAGHRGVEQLAGQDRRRRLGEDHGDGAELRALALVDRHRMHRVDGRDAPRAELDDRAAALERRHDASVACSDDDARVTVVQAQRVVVL